MNLQYTLSRLAEQSGFLSPFQNFLGLSLFLYVLGGARFF